MPIKKVNLIEVFELPRILHSLEFLITLSKHTQIIMPIKKNTQNYVEY